MVIDKLCQAQRYEALHPRFQEAFAFLREANDKPNGRYDLGDGLYVNLSEAHTHTAGELPLEAHRKYIDIQYLFDGHSACGWAQTGELTTKTPYDEAKDAEFLTGACGYVPVSAGMFYILFPNDAHEPHCTDGEPSAYRVAVVKVPV